MSIGRDRKRERERDKKDFDIPPIRVCFNAFFI